MKPLVDRLHALTVQAERIYSHLALRLLTSRQGGLRVRHVCIGLCDAADVFQVGVPNLEHHLHTSIGGAGSVFRKARILIVFLRPCDALVHSWCNLAGSSHRRHIHSRAVLSFRYTDHMPARDGELITEF